jgi:hypothetical protein
MDKPVSLSVREYLVRTMAVKLMVPEKVIDAVVAHQFSEANKAMGNNYSVEISGFGKFLFNHKKAIKKLATLYAQKAHFEKVLATDGVSEQRKISSSAKLASVIEAINILKPRIYEAQLLTDTGGMEEQADSPSSHEGIDRKDS